MKTPITIEQLERMKTHELAELLGNIALLLKRLPDVECGQLAQQIGSDTVFTQVEFPQRSLPSSPFTEAGLRKKRVEELKKIADDLLIPYPARIKKDDLVSKILARPASRRSEQFAIQDL
jgi:Rho termination factor, N-terminal domain